MMHPSDITVYTTFHPYKRGIGYIIRMALHLMDSSTPHCRDQKRRFNFRVLYLQPYSGAPGETAYHPWAVSCLGVDWPKDNVQEFSSVDRGIEWLMEGENAPR